jgi:hypothetical protein
MADGAPLTPTERAVAAAMMAELRADFADAVVDGVSLARCCR